jgi:predicted Fe-Mo cluster-binding NifX family protein
MKLAIPTNDGLSISPDFIQAKGFLILTIELGAITREEILWNTKNDNHGSSEGIPDAISDCQVVMVNNIGHVMNDLLSVHKKEVIRTPESIITNAYVQFMGNTVRKKADTCCCP